MGRCQQLTAADIARLEKREPALARGRGRPRKLPFEDPDWPLVSISLALRDFNHGENSAAEMMARHFHSASRAWSGSHELAMRLRWVAADIKTTAETIVKRNRKILGASTRGDLRRFDAAADCVCQAIDGAAKLDKKMVSDALHKLGSPWMDLLRFAVGTRTVQAHPASTPRERAIAVFVEAAIEFIATHEKQSPE